MSGSVILQTPNAEPPWGLKLRHSDLTREIAFAPSNLRHILSVRGFMAFDSHECGPYRTWIYKPNAINAVKGDLRRTCSLEHGRGAGPRQRHLYSGVHSEGCEAAKVAVMKITGVGQLWKGNTCPVRALLRDTADLVPAGWTVLDHRPVQGSRVLRT
jgi:hypothetical protein